MTISAILTCLVPLPAACRDVDASSTGMTKFMAEEVSHLTITPDGRLVLDDGHAILHDGPVEFFVDTSPTNCGAFVLQGMFKGGRLQGPLSIVDTYPPHEEPQQTIGRRLELWLWNKIIIAPLQWLVIGRKPGLHRGERP